MAEIADTSSTSVLAALTTRQWAGLGSVLNGCPDAFFAVDPSGVIRATNAAAQTNLAPNGPSVLGRTLYDFLAPGEAARRRVWLEQVVRTAAPYVGLGYLGEQRFNVRLVPLVKTDGAVALVTVHATEVTTSTQQREALQATRDQLVRAQKLESVGQLAGGIAHDFNNLLTAIVGFSQLAMRRLASDEAALDDLEEVLAAARRGSELVQQLLGFSRNDAVEVRNIDLSECISRIESLIRRLTGESFALSFDLSKSPLPVSMDRGRLEQVVVNLLTNARDATPVGGTVSVSTHLLQLASDEIPGLTTGRYALLEVQDSGAGIPADIREHIFEAFFTTKGVGAGTGLGLSTSHGIVTQAGGHIRFESEMGRGTTFRVYLPLV